MADQLAYFTVTTGASPGVYSYDTVTNAVALLVGTESGLGDLAITPANDLLYAVASPPSNSVTVYDLVHNTRSGFSLAVGKVAASPCIDATGTYLYLLDPTNFVIYQIDIATNTLHATSAPYTSSGVSPLYMTIAPDGNHLYISGYSKIGGVFYVTVVALPGMTVVTNIALPATVANLISGIVAVTPDSAKGYVLSFNAGATELILVVLDLSTNTVTTTINLLASTFSTFGPAFAVDSSDLFYVSDGHVITVSQVDYSTDTLVGNVTLPDVSYGVGVPSSEDEIVSTQETASNLVLTALPGYAQTTVSVAGQSTYLVMGSPPTTEQIVMIV